MAIGKKTGGRNFPVGHKLATGRPPLPEDLKQVRRLNRDELERVLNRFINLTLGEIKEIIRDPITPAIDLMVGRIVESAIINGDQVRLSFILDHLVGKVATNLKITNVDPLAGARVILYMPDNGRPVYEIKKDEPSDD